MFAPLIYISAVSGVIALLTRLYSNWIYDNQWSHRTLHSWTGVPAVLLHVISFMSMLMHLAPILMYFLGARLWYLTLPNYITL